MSSTSAAARSESPAAPERTAAACNTDVHKFDVASQVRCWIVVANAAMLRGKLDVRLQWPTQTETLCTSMSSHSRQGSHLALRQLPAGFRRRLSLLSCSHVRHLLVTWAQE